MSLFDRLQAVTLLSELRIVSIDIILLFFPRDGHELISEFPYPLLFIKRTCYKAELNIPWATNSFERDVNCWNRKDMEHRGCGGRFSTFYSWMNLSAKYFLKDSNASIWVSGFIGSFRKIYPLSSVLKRSIEMVRILQVVKIS